MDLSEHNTEQALPLWPFHLHVCASKNLLVSVGDLYCLITVLFKTASKTIFSHLTRSTMFSCFAGSMTVIHIRPFYV